MKLFKLFILSIIFFSCSSKKEPETPVALTPKIIKKIEYNVGFPYSLRYSGVYYDKTIDKEFYYFGDAVTQKKIVFYNDKKELINTLLLDTIINDGEYLHAISIISLDTIVALTKYTNKVYFLDKKGKCFNILDLNFLVKDKNNKYEYTVRSDNFYRRGYFYFDVEWRGDSLINALTTQVEATNYFHNKNRTAPFLLRINDVFNQPVAEQLLDSFRMFFIEKDELTVMPPVYTFANDQLIIYRTSSNKIYVYPANNIVLGSEKVITIKSDYGIEVGYKTLLVNKETYAEVHEKASYMAKTFASVEEVVYDEKKQQYLIMVRHSIKNLSELKKERKWSICIYDNDFNKLDEILVTNKEWSWGQMKYTKQGLLVLNNKNLRSENDNYDPTLYKAAIFEFSK